MADGARPWRDILIQVLATVMIPVTVAGTGLYYTRWQQNLNDLKTMIDLVSDQSPEKRKYGVAMFEYLLKNDKVPVEFVAAQLSYANSSADKELLPLMEQALLKASAENGKVADTFRQALERMPSRVFIHAMNEAQRACLRSLLPRIKDTDSTNNKARKNPSSGDRTMKAPVVSKPGHTMEPTPALASGRALITLSVAGAITSAMPAARHIMRSMIPRYGVDTVMVDSRNSPIVTIVRPAATVSFVPNFATMRAEFGAMMSMTIENGMKRTPVCSGV